MRSLIIAGGFTAINYSLVYLTNMLLARWLGPEQYGDYSVGFALVTLLSAFITLGFEKLVLKNLPVYADDKNWRLYRGFLRAAWLLILGCGLALALLLWTGYEGFHSLFKHDKHSVVVFAFLLSPILALSFFALQVLNANKNFLAGTGMKNLFNPIILLLLIYFIHQLRLDFNAPLAFFCFSASVASSLCLCLLIIRLDIPREALNIRPEFELNTWLRMSIPFMVNSLVMISIQRSGVLLLEVFSPREGHVGIFAASAIIASFITKINYISDSYFLPRIAPLLEHGDINGVNDQLKKRLLFLFIVGSTFLLIIIFFGRRILNLFHPHFEAGYPVLVMFSVGAVISSLGAVAPVLFQFLGFSRFVIRMSVGVLLVLLLLSSVLIPFLHGMGAVLGYIIPFTIALAIQLRILARNHNIKIITILRNK